MLYFSSDNPHSKSYRFCSGLPEGGSKHLYTPEYPEAFIIEQKEASAPKKSEDEFREEKIRSQTSKLSILRTAVTLLLLFLSAIYIVKPQIPSYIEDFYMSVQELIKPAYKHVEAMPFSEQNVTAEDIVSRETIVVEPMYTYTEDSDRSYVQDAIMRTLISKNDVNESVTVYAESTENDSAEDVNRVTAGGIIGKDLSVGSDKIYSSNETRLSPNMNALAVAAYPIEVVSAEEESPQVLIVHTHGTECYADSKGGAARSTDRSENVVRVGKELCEVLNFYGITTLHSETMHDEISYLKAYSSSKAEVEKLLKLHPTIKYVIDLHRDAIPNDGGKRVKPVTDIAGEQVAQVMLVVGTNDAGANHPRYEDNLTVASHLQSTLNELYPSLARPINIRSAAFNQGFGAGCMLLEVGSDANTLEEALKAVRLFGAGFSKVICGE